MFLGKTQSRVINKPTVILEENYYNDMIFVLLLLPLTLAILLQLTDEVLTRANMKALREIMK